jgi:diguanylate cyclase (GGDEF)-like protein
MPVHDTASGSPVATICARALAIRHREPGAARELAERAAAAAVESGEPGDRRRAVAALAASLASVPAEVLRARRLLEDVMRQCAAAGDDALLCEVLNELGGTYVSTAEFEPAAEHLRAALELARARGARGEEARALRQLGSVGSSTGEFAGALSLLLDALRIHEEERGGHPGELDDAAHWERGSLFSRIGVVYSNLDQFEKAISYYEVALESFGERYPHRAGRTLYRMGIAADELGDRDRAERYYRRSLEIHERHGQREARAVTLLGIGGVLTERGAFDEAAAALAEALESLEHDLVHHAHYSDGLWMLAEVHLRRGEAAEALALLERALPLYRAAARPDAHLAALHHRLYRGCRMLGEWQRALEHHETFHRLTVQHHEERADSRLAEMMARFDTERALRDGEVARLRSTELEREVAERREVEAALARAKAELEARNRELHALTIRDALTGLFNRRHLDERLAEAFALAGRKGTPLSVMICDIDDFKRINDTFSHAVGDEVLRTLASLLRDNLRQSDVAARFGGEEFVVLFPGSALGEARAAADKLCHRVAAYPWAALHPGLAVTISAGVAAVDGHASGERLLSDADRNLYDAKRRGKNRVVA